MKLCEKYPEDFEKITLCIHKNVLRSIKSQIAIRGMTGNAYGLLDAFLFKLVEEHEKGYKAIEFIKKEDKVKYDDTKGDEDS